MNLDADRIRPVRETKGMEHDVTSAPEACDGPGRC